MPEQLGKALIVMGAVLIAAGLLLVLGRNLPFGKMPGDITIKGENFTFYFPIVTGLVISALLTLIFLLFGRK